MFARDRDLDKTILVGNIHSCVTEDILYELFLQAGPVEKVRIFRDGRQAPYGCVSYKHAEAVPYAVALLSGIWLYGQPIKLQLKTDAVHQYDVVLNLNGSPDLEIHSNEAYSWRDMVYSRRLDVCPPAVWFWPPLQQWMGSGDPSGTSCLHENAFVHRSASSRVGCANVSLDSIH
ncbi:RNA binding motif protein 11 [Garra rufa]|uniref:RNA binding motif protein 11 n=1 Tax=Garra rufa TaxID=137080 RepID=UPI003CCECCCE